MNTHKWLYFVLLGALFYPVFAGPKLGDTLKNDDYNYFLKVPRKWNTIPVQPGEQYIIDKMQGKADAGVLPGLEVLVFNTSKPVVTENTGISFGKSEGPPIGSPEWQEKMNARFEEMNRKTSFDHYLQNQLTGKWSEKEIKKRYEIPWKKGKYRKAQVYELAYKTSSANSLFYEIACAYRLGNVEYVVTYNLHKDTIDDDRDVYLQSFRSFMVTGEATGIKKKVVDLTKLSPKQRRKAVKKGLPKGWWAYDTKRYVILTNVDDKSFVKELATHLEGIRDLYERVFPPEKEIKALSVVRLCGSRQEYHGYGGPGGSAGYFSSGTQELVIYDDSKQNKTNTFATLYHECFHQYTYYFFGELSAHRWYDEGLGDYFAGADYKNGKFVIKKFDWRTETIRKAVQQGKNYHIKEFVKMPRSKYYGDADVCYSQGWAFIYFLTLTRHPKWSQIIRTYIKVLMETKDRNKAVDVAFEGINYDKINQAFIDFVGSSFKIK